MPEGHGQLEKAAEANKHKMVQAMGRVDEAMKAAKKYAGERTWKGGSAEEWRGELKGRMGKIASFFEEAKGAQDKEISEAREKDKKLDGHF